MLMGHVTSRSWLAMMCGLAGTRSERPQTWHWDGTGIERIDTPMPSDALTAAFSAIDASSRDDVWAVGDLTRAATRKGFVEHWDGTRWSIVPTPHVQGQTAFVAVSANSVADVWLVGSRTLSGGAIEPLVEHWDG